MYNVIAWTIYCDYMYLEKRFSDYFVNKTERVYSSEIPV